ncbi:MAG: FHA domain-containing protein [Calditrichaeota bacterium]|nr:MAG: FHA domain-containing protein [Calditrichota bacterium]
MAKIRIRKLSDAGWCKEVELKKTTLVIGRGKTCDIPLEDPRRMVSRQHARLERDRHGYRLIDLKSLNATLLNDQRLEPHQPYPLADGDRIQIGEYVIEYRENGAVSKSRPAAQAVERGRGNPGMPPIPPGGRRNPAIRLTPGHMGPLLEAVLHLARYAATFRQEFIGIQPLDADQPFHTMTPEQLKSYLLDATLSPEEARRRFRWFEVQLQELSRHYQAVEAGYRAAQKAVHNYLLQHLDPDKVDRQAAKQPVRFLFLKLPRRWFPFATRRRANRMLRQLLNDLLIDGPKVFEQKVVRKAFIEAYMEAMMPAEEDGYDSRHYWKSA